MRGVINRTRRGLAAGRGHAGAGRDAWVGVAGRRRRVQPGTDSGRVLTIVAREGVYRQTAGIPGVDGTVQAADCSVALYISETKDVEAILVQVTEATAKVEATGCAAGLLGLVCSDSDRAATKVVFGDEVDHTADSIRAVQRRCAIAQHFNALDRGKRDHVQVNGLAVDRVRGDPATVQQHQRLGSAQAANVGERCATSSGTNHLTGALLGLDDAKLSHNLLYAGHALLDELVHLDDGNWNR